MELTPLFLNTAGKYVLATDNAQVGGDDVLLASQDVSSFSDPSMHCPALHLMRIHSCC